MAQGLGRGLSSLIPQKVNKVATTASGEAVVSVTGDDEKDKILQIDPGKIKINPMQPRKKFTDNEMTELVDSIRLYGIIQPLIVTEKNGEFELIAGERRMRAAKILKMPKVPAIVRQASDQEKLEVALVENVQRSDLNPIETALAYRKLVDEFNLSQDDVAKRVGKARSSVANTMRYLNLPETIQAALSEGKISEGHAKYLIGFDSIEKQMSLFKKILHGNLTVSDTADEARKFGGTKSARIKINYADKDKEFAFREFFGAKVQIKRKGHGGQVIMDFFSDDELYNMVAKIKGQ